MTPDEPITSLIDLLSNESQKLLTTSGTEMIQKIGIETVRGVVLDVLSVTSQ